MDMSDASWEGMDRLPERLRDQVNIFLYWAGTSILAGSTLRIHKDFRSLAGPEVLQKD
jgi:hypothetical protein